MADPAGGRLDPKNWPGTDSDGKETVIHKDQVKTVVKALQADLDRYDNANSGTPADLQGLGAGYKGIIGDGPPPKAGYAAGQKLGEFLQNASTHIPQAYQQFLNSYKAVIESLEKQTGVYTDAETTNKTNVSNSTTDNSSYYG